MSNKKQLLTESEVRRFMALADIPVINRPEINENLPMAAKPEDRQEYGSLARNENETVQEEEMLDMAADELGGDQEDAGEEMGGEEEAAGGEDKEAKFQELVTMLADLVGVDVEMDASGEAADEEEMEAPADEKEEEEGEEDSEESEEGEADEENEGETPMMEEQEEETDEAKKYDHKMDEALINTVLARVTARLLEEAKKKKKMTAAEKKKEEMKKKAAAAKKKKADGADDKKELKEANAPAPKSSMSNGSKAGVAKGHGPGSSVFGTKKQADQEWKEGEKNSKGGHELHAAPSEGKHTVSHGKTSPVTGKGGNKK